MDGVQNGFKLFDVEPVGLSYKVNNFKSALMPDTKAKLDVIFKKELAEQTLSVINYVPQCVHGILAVPRKGKPDDPRPVTHASKPYDNSVNDNMFPAKVKYNTVDTATKLVTPGCWFSVIDLHHAYRSIPVFPSHRDYMGYKWQFDGEKDPVYMRDNYLCFGLRCAPSIFTRISDAVARIFNRIVNRKDIFICNYLDDYLLICPTDIDCQWAQRVLINILRRLGLSISWDKITGPNQCIKYLGLEISSLDMQIRLPQDKLLRLKEELHKFLEKKSASKRQLLSLCGLMSFCSTVIKGARTYSRRVIDLANSLKRLHYKCRVSAAFRKDLTEFWIPFMDLFNGSAKIMDSTPIPITCLQTDSSLRGYGIYYLGDWRAGYWNSQEVPDQWFTLLQNWKNETVTKDIENNINYLELYTALLAARAFGAKWRDKRVVLYIDNTQAMALINKGTSRNSLVMDWLRELFWLSVINNFHITARYLRSKDNWIADKLSRMSNCKDWTVLNSRLTNLGLPLFYRYST